METSRSKLNRKSRGFRLGQPPCGNTGVKKPSGPAMSVCLDWLAVTFHISNASASGRTDSPLFISTVLKKFRCTLAEFVLQPTGGNGYTVRYYCEDKHITFMLHPDKPEMGLHVVLTGTGCALLFQQIDPASLIQQLLSEKTFRVSFSRIDFTLDDKTGKYYLPEEVLEEIEAGNVSSRFKTYQGKFRKTFSDHSFMERTLYIGDINSDCSLKIYDKLLEQTGICSQHDGSSWIRRELTFRHKETCLAFLTALVESDFNFALTFFGVLSYRFRIIQQDSTRKTRCSNAPLWDAFTAAAPKIQLYFELSRYSDVERICIWFDNQVGPSLAALYDLEGYGLAYIVDLIHRIKEEGRSREFERPSTFAS